MPTYQFTPKRPPYCPLDAKSEVSTEGDECADYACLDAFASLTKGYESYRTPKSKLKSSLCRNFTETGICSYGSKCQFAHGIDELRVNEDVNCSYKTKPCNAFFKKGHCHYGYRCNFVHQNGEQNQEKEWKLMRENHKQVFEYLQEKRESRLMQILDEGQM